MRKLRLTDDQRKMVEENIGLAYGFAQRAAREMNLGRYADDVTQSAMEGLCIAAATFDPAKGKFSAWAYTHMKSTCMDICRQAPPVTMSSYHHRKGRRVERGSLKEAARLADRGVGARRIESEILVRELKGVVVREVSDLPERDAAILRGRFCEGKTFEDLGAAYGVSKQRVEQIVLKKGERVVLAIQKAVA